MNTGRPRRTSEYAQIAEQRNYADGYNDDLSHLLHRRVNRKFLHEVQQQSDDKACDQAADYDAE
jgi:hypothetical protein